MTTPTPEPAPAPTISAKDPGAATVLAGISAKPKKTSVLARYRKAIAGAVGLIAEAVAGGLVHGVALHIAQAVIAVAGVAGIVASPKNAQP